MRLVSLDSGSVELQSETSKPLGGIIEKPALYGYLSARENLYVFSRVQGLALTRQHYLELMEQVGLPADREDPVRNYSMGMKQRLGLAIALLNNPACVILDEPFSGLDPIGIRALQQQVKSLAEERRIGVLISSHNLVELGDLCDRLYVINQGEIIREGPAQQVLQAAARGYLLYGDGFLASRVLQSEEVEFRQGSALLFPHARPIDEVLKTLALEDGVTLRGCVPQTDLRTLFQKEGP